MIPVCGTYSRCVCYDLILPHTYFQSHIITVCVCHICIVGRLYFYFFFKSYFPAGSRCSPWGKAIMATNTAHLQDGFLDFFHWFVFSFPRWKYGSRTNDPNTRRSWRTGPADLRETTSPPHRRRPPPRALCGTSPWPAKARRCTLEDTWTISDTGTRDTSRTPCRGLRWCDGYRRKQGAAHPGQFVDLYRQADWSFSDANI